MPIIVRAQFSDDEFSRCKCNAYQHCRICDPAFFRANQEMAPHNPGRREQEEAAIVETLLSAIEEHLRGFSLKVQQTFDTETNELVVDIRREDVPSSERCRVRIQLEV